MRSQFIKIIQDLCRRRSSESSEVEWWFSDSPPQAHRVGAIHDEHTLPFGQDPDVEPPEDPPLDDEFFHEVLVS